MMRKLYILFCLLIIQTNVNATWFFSGSGSGGSGGVPTDAHQYKFDNGALTTDSTGSDTLTSNGTPTADTTTYKEGDASSDMDGASDYYTLASCAWDVQTFSVTFWIYFDALETTSRTIMTKTDTDGSNKNFEIRIIQSDDSTYPSEIQFSTSDDGTNWQSVYNGTALVSGRWYNIGVSYNDTGQAYILRIWDDTAGAIHGSEQTGDIGDAINESTCLFKIGARYNDGARGFNGKIDDFRYFDTVLTSAQIDSVRGDI